MRKSERLEYWLSRALLFSEDDLDDIADVLTPAGNDED
jgi:hypothetical protein